MRYFQCPNCNKNGIGWFGRYFSGRLLPVKCKYCSSCFYIKQNLVYTSIFSIIDCFMGIILLFLTIAYKNIFFILGYFFVSTFSFYVFHRNAPLIMKKKFEGQ